MNMKKTEGGKSKVQDRVYVQFPCEGHREPPIGEAKAAKTTIIAVVNDGVPVEEAEKNLRDAGYTVVNSTPRGLVYLSDPDAKAEDVAKVAGIKSAEPNKLRHTC